MTEPRRQNMESRDSFNREVLDAMAAARAEGATAADEIATALNRSGVLTWRGRQWDAELVLRFLADPDVERLAD
ncbi:MAG: hypothetical protein QNJ94_21890 [Alphaproteobacteria bacterium]|nr:hypothetical protein [Alphaproteobacteria bacterium]